MDIHLSIRANLGVIADESELNVHGRDRVGPPGRGGGIGWYQSDRGIAERRCPFAMRKKGDRSPPGNHYEGAARVRLYFRSVSCYVRMLKIIPHQAPRTLGPSARRKEVDERLIQVIFSAGVGAGGPVSGLTSTLAIGHPRSLAKEAVGPSTFDGDEIRSPGRTVRIVYPDMEVS